MAMNPLPPQAYTKETLQKAYQWLLNQSPSIKEMASNQDILISLYLKAQRNGDASLEAPSIQNFKQELKSLAHMMGDFQGPAASASTTLSAAHTASMSATHASLSAARNVAKTHAHEGSGLSGTSSLASTAGSPFIPSSNSVGASPSSSSHGPATGSWTASTDLSGASGLDQHSLLLVQEVKMSLNLSTDVEALRALISIGHRQFKKLNS